MKKFLAISGFLLLSLSPISGVQAKIEKLGDPIRLSPIPGPFNPDPVLQNLPAVMDDFFVFPWYPGGAPDFLSQITLLSDCYTFAGLVINPLDDRIVLAPIGQNFILDDTGTIPAMIPTNTLARSFDGGISWIYGPPIEQTIPLGGTISQLINSSIGPGLAMRYTKCGTLYAYGQGFDDLRPNPPETVPQTGFLFSTSEDNGETWTKPKKILSSDVNWWFNLVSGWTWWDFYVNHDPANPNLLHGTASTELMPIQNDPNFGNLYYTRSEDFGKTFSPMRQVYSMVNDPVWMALHFDPDYVSNPNYFTTGGFSAHSAVPVVYDDNIVLQPISRWYPAVGSPDYTAFPPDTVFDQALVRSLDKGQTWEPVAGATDQYVLTFGPHDPGYLDPFDGLFVTSSGQICNIAVSQSTGRIYMIYEAGNPAADPDPFINQIFPFILLSVSNDKGETFQPAVQINRTPTNISAGAQQTFAPGMTISSNGYLVVCYYDFRNWTGTPGEDIDTTPLQCDAWVDIYKEVKDPHGGSTGVGLDFVQEIRLTNQSFNARYGTQSIINSAAGNLEGIRPVVNNGNILYVPFSTTNPTSDANITTGYKGMTIDTNSVFNIFLQRIKLPKPSNQ